MGWKIVQQPDGNLARFTSVVNNFTDMGMSDAEALSICQDYVNPSQAKAIVMRALNRPDPEKEWENCLRIIVESHGYEALKFTLEEADLSEFLLPEAAFSQPAD